MNKANFIVNVSYFGVFIACAMLPLKTTLSNFGIIVLLCLTFFSFMKNGINVELLGDKHFFINTTTVLFIPIAIGCMYAINQQEAFQELGKNIFYLLMPIVALRNDIDWQKALTISIFGLIIGCTISMIYLQGINLINFLDSNLPITKLLSYNFTGLNFVKPLKDMHPLYLGVYYLFLIIGIWQPYIKIKVWIKITLSTLILITILFLNSRSVFLSGVLLFVFYGFSLIKSKKGMIMALVIGLIMILAHPIYKKTFVYNKLINGTLWELQDNIATKNTDSKRTSDSRMSRWLVALDIIRDSPLIGQGTDSEKELLVAEYEIRKMKLSAKSKYDSHNQYLSYALQYGIFGVAMLLLFLCSNVLKSIKYKDKLLLTFIIIITTVSLTENFFNRNMGINFIALLSTLFYKMERRK